MSFATFTTGVEAALKSLGSELTGALDPLEPYVDTAKATASMVDDITKYLQSQFTAHNTAAMQTAAQAAQEQEIEAKAKEAIDEAKKGNPDAYNSGVSA